MNAVHVSEIDILEWIGKLGTAGTGQDYAKEKLLESGTDALPWLVRAFNGEKERNEEIAELVRKIASANGIPRKGGKAIRKIISLQA